MGGIQSESSLPGYPTFSHTYNIYDTSSFKRMYTEFGISPSAEFRFKGDNHGLATVFIYVSYVGSEADNSTTCPGRNNSAMRVEKLSKEFFCFHGHYFYRYSVTFLA